MVRVSAIAMAHSCPSGSASEIDLRSRKRWELWRILHNAHDAEPGIMRTGLCGPRGCRCWWMSGAELGGWFRIIAGRG